MQECTRQFARANMIRPSASDAHLVASASAHVPSPVAMALRLSTRDRAHQARSAVDPRAMVRAVPPTRWRRPMCMCTDARNSLGSSGDILQRGFTMQARKLPNQAESVFSPTGNAEDFIRRVPVAEANTKSVSDLDYLTELMAIQQSDGPKNIGFFGTRNMGVTHQKLVEVLSYAYASTGNHLYTSGAIGTNAAVIKGALRANAPDKLTVIIPQSLKRQPAESQELLLQVQNLVEMPENDELSLLEASRICNRKIIGHVQQVICFAFHDSRLLMETCHEAKDSKKIVTLFFLD